MITHRAIKTKKDLLHHLAKIPFEDKKQRNKLVCALVGHSRIQKYCLGFANCSRCGEQVGDSLCGVHSWADKVIIGHDCKTCRANYAKCDWKDKIFTPNPFRKKSKAGMARVAEL